MRVSLFLRMVLVYMLIAIALVLSFAGVFKYYYLRQEFSEIEQHLSDRVKTLQDIYQITSGENLNKVLQSYAKSETIDIYLCDSTGLLLSTYSHNNTVAAIRRLNASDTKQFITPVLSGNLVKSYSMPGENTPHKAIAISALLDKRTLTVVVLNYDMTQIYQKFGNIDYSLILPVGFSLIMGTLLILWMNYRLTSPLKQITSLAKDIAKGRYDARVSVMSADEIGQLAATFNQMCEDLNSLDRLRKGFIASITHELRSPLTSIGGFIQGMLDGTVPDNERAHYLRIALGETRRLSVLINQLLDLSKLESGNYNLDKTEFDICELIRKIIINLETRINDKRITVLPELPETKVHVFADSDRIEQVVYNLLDNAIKYSNNRGEIRIKVMSSGQNAYITVADTGPGISEEDQKFIWTMFYTGNKSRTAGYGYGLGLSIVKTILDQHNQSIKLESELGTGTRITFSLDLVVRK